MLKRKSRSIAALTSAVLFINAGICTFTATAAETTLPAVESTENISDEIYFATLSGVLSTEVGAYAGTELVGYTLDRFYEIGESPIEFQIEDETVAEITQIQGTIVNIKGISIGETTLTANLPNGKTLSIEVIVSEPICTTTTAIFCPYPSYTTTTAIEENGNQTEEQEYYTLYIDTLPTKTEYMIGEELDITGTRIYGSYTNGMLVGDIFPTDLARYLENGMMTLDDSEFDNTKAGTYTIYIHYGTATASFEVTVIDEETDLPDELTLHCLPYRIDFDLNMELDLSGAVISGSYGEKGECYEFHGEYLTDMIEKGIVEVDVSEYNSSEIGTYTIYVKLGTAVESFDVRVGCPLVQNILEIKALPNKTVYNYGEELDLTGAEIYGWARGDGGKIPDIEFTEDLQTLVDNETIKIDDSEFYETKSGICTIYLNYGHAWASFEVTVNDESIVATGDTNGDGNFTIADMVMVQKHIMGKKTASPFDWKCADLYEDGKIDVYDFILMRKNIVEKMK